MKLCVRNIYLYTLILCFFLVGCKVRRPHHIIPEEKMEKLLYDYHIAKAMGENLPYNENYKKALYIESVFEKYGTDQAMFDSSIVWYSRNADVFSKIYEKVNERLKKELSAFDHLISVRDNKPKISQRGDSIDVWLSKRMLHLDHTLLNNRMAFVVTSDSNFQARDTLEWNVRYRFFNTTFSDSIRIAVMSMAIQYTNDSVISLTKSIFGPGTQTIRLQSDTLKNVKEIRGFIYLTGENDSIHHLFADQISLMRYHSTDSLFDAKTDSLNADKITKEEDIDINVIKPEPLNPELQERLTPEEMRRIRPRPLQKSTAVEEKIKPENENR